MVLEFEKVLLIQTDIASYIRRLKESLEFEAIFGQIWQISYQLLILTHERISKLQRKSINNLDIFLNQLRQAHNFLHFQRKLMCIRDIKLHDIPLKIKQTFVLLHKLLQLCGIDQIRLRINRRLKLLQQISRVSFYVENLEDFLVFKLVSSDIFKGFGEGFYEFGY